MSLATTLSRAAVGLAAPQVTVEVHLANGLPRFSVVGMPETSVRESRERVRAAIVQSGFDFPDTALTVYLAPADLPKLGGRYDLAIALGVLAATEQIPAASLENTEFYGELSLSGQLRKTACLLPAALQAERHDHAVFAPAANVPELEVLEHVELYVADHLAAVTAHLGGYEALTRVTPSLKRRPRRSDLDLADVCGQTRARRALEIAATGGHSLLMVGPPGSGKSMLARRVPSLLPDLSHQQALDVASVISLSGRSRDPTRFFEPPFRAPHHTASAPALVGGGSVPRPGEISLAHHGVLFLDEVAEYPRHVLEVLREPLETGEVCISRAARQEVFPARFQLIAAMNPCPCGFHGDKELNCRCTPDQIRRYRQKLSGPFLDRIDLQLVVERVSVDLLTTGTGGESSANVAARSVEARQRAVARRGTCNARLTNPLKQDDCQLDNTATALLSKAAKHFHLSARAIAKLIAVSRTIADLAEADDINEQHLGEALSLRIDL